MGFAGKALVLFGGFLQRIGAISKIVLSVNVTKIEKCRLQKMDCVLQ